MKTLLIVRHAKSSWKDSSLSDFDRPLNKRGKRDAPIMGKRLKQRGILPDMIVSSPAERAITTANIIAEEIGFPVDKIAAEKSIYLTEVAGLLKVVRNFPKNRQTIMLFGHNPALTLFANYLSGEEIDNLPTCGIFCIEFDVDSWKDIGEASGRCVFFDYPKKQGQ